MNLLPLVQREFTVASRRPLTWWLRVLVGTVAGTCFLLATAAARNPAQLGQGLFATLAVIAFVLAALAGTRYAALPLCEENRENTMGLLLLTPLRRFEVVLGRLAGAVLEGTGALVALLPVLTLALLAGGVTLGQVGMAALALALTLVLSNAVGLYVAATRTNELQVMLISLLMTAAACLPFCWMLLGVLLTAELDGRQQRELAFGRPRTRWQGVGVPMLWMPLVALFAGCLGLQAGGAMAMFASPVYLLYLAVSDGPPTVFALSATGTLWLIGFLVWLTGTRLAIIDLDERERAARQPVPVALPGPTVGVPGRPAPVRFTGDLEPAGRPRRRSRPSSLLSRGPLVWLLHPSDDRRRMIWASAIAVALSGLFPLPFDDYSGPVKEMIIPMLAPFVFCGYVLSPVFEFLVAWHAARLFVEARKSGSLELLLVTPEFRTQAVRDVWRSLKATFGAPVALILTARFLGPILALPWNEVPVKANFTPEFGLLVMGTAMAAKVATLAALAWMGIWQGWCSTRPGLAAGKAWCFVSLLPSLFLSAFLGVSMFAPWSGPALVLHLARLLIGTSIAAYAYRRLKGTFVAGAPPVEQRRT